MLQAVRPIDRTRRKVSREGLRFAILADNRLLLLKKRHRHLKLLLSIGGWTYSSHFAAVKTAAGRSKFVSSAMKIVEDVGLDGLDVDWEYPKNREEATQYVHLLGELRTALNARANAVQGRHWLSIAAPCGEQMRTLDVKAMDRECICLSVFPTVVSTETDVAVLSHSVKNTSTCGT